MANRLSEHALDKIFLPSYKDYLNTEYGFPSTVDKDKSRACKTSDWCRVNCSFAYEFEDAYLNGSYYTRSPISHETDCWSISQGGRLTYIGNYKIEDYSVRPCMNLKIIS